MPMLSVVEMNIKLQLTAISEGQEDINMTNMATEYQLLEKKKCSCSKTMLDA